MARDRTFPAPASRAGPARILTLPFLVLMAGLVAWFPAAAQTPPRLAASKYFPERTEFALLQGPLVRDGKPWSLADQKGKFVAIVLWSVDCRYCYEELPDLHAFWARHKAKGFELVGLSVDDSAEEVREYLVRYRKLGFPVLWRMQDGVRDGFARAVGTPTLYIVDRQGEIVFKRFGQLREEHYAWIAEQLERPR